MSTQPIEHTVQGYTYKRRSKASGDAEFSLGPEQSKKRQETGAETSPGARDYIRTLLSQVQGCADGRVSFQAVVDHHSAIQQQWNDAVREDLTGLGVDVSAPFRLVYDPAGGVSMAGDHGSREMITAYFATNPERALELGEVLQFGKLAGVAEGKLTPQDMSQTLQTEAMAWWYSSNMDTGSLFSGGGVLFGTSGAAYKSLDIRV